LEAAALEAVAAARTHRATSAARVAAGVAPRLDSLRAQVDLARRTAAEVRASEAVRVAFVELGTTIGVTLDTTAFLVAPGDLPLDAPDVAAATDQALHQRPELATLDETLRENELRLDAARAAHRPTVNLSATAQYLGPNR